jgi:hypothetical protein
MHKRGFSGAILSDKGEYLPFIEGKGNIREYRSTIKILGNAFKAQQGCFVHHGQAFQKMNCRAGKGTLKNIQPFSAPLPVRHKKPAGEKYPAG